MAQLFFLWVFAITYALFSSFIPGLNPKKSITLNFIAPLLNSFKCYKSLGELEKEGGSLQKSWSGKFCKTRQKHLCGSRP